MLEGMKQFDRERAVLITGIGYVHGWNDLALPLHVMSQIAESREKDTSKCM